MNWDLFFHWFTLVAGVVAVIYPSVWAYWCWQGRPGGIGKPLALMLGGEAFSRVFGVWFAWTSITGDRAHLEPEILVSNRLAIIAIPLITTVILVRHMRKTARGENGGFL